MCFVKLIVFIKYTKEKHFAQNVTSLKINRHIKLSFRFSLSVLKVLQVHKELKQLKRKEKATKIVYKY